MRKKILVTGSEGFIGSHLVEKLIKQKYNVVCLCLYNSFNSWGWLDDLRSKKHNNCQFVMGDVRDFNLIDSIVSECDLIFHLASLISIPYSYQAVNSYYDVNLKGTLNILESAKKHKIKKIIHISTSEIYGSAKFIPITEEHPVNAQSPYAASKIAADQLAISYFKSFNTPVTIARPFNTYGPRQSLRAIIPSILLQLINKEKNLLIGSGFPLRDFCFIEDTIRGLIEIVHSKNTEGETFNIGSGFSISINELCKICMKVLNHEIPIKYENTRKRPKNSEVDHLKCSYKKINRELGWKPKFGGKKGLIEGIKNFTKWLEDSNKHPQYRGFKDYIY